MDENQDDIDWSLTTWEGSRRAQLRHALTLTVRERLEAAERLGRCRAAVRGDQTDWGGQEGAWSGEDYIPASVRYRGARRMTKVRYISKRDPTDARRREAGVLGHCDFALFYMKLSHHPAVESLVCSRTGKVKHARPID